MTCQRCQSPRVASVSGKTADLCYVNLGDEELDGYVPSDMGIGRGDYIRFSWCLTCGQIQGDFPLDPCSLEEDEDT